ncbi:F-box/WD repeat-containing protein 10-like [Symsagittifera roscoffensis]|uniref:F-box/WD repeat-containing protein 10-like n=1 Tax=Symsagittifera roscoffensis TaxID=84072 RepID=UPI00307C3A28
MKTEATRRGFEPKRPGGEELYNNIVVKCTVQGEVLTGDRDDLRVCGECEACQLHGYVTRTVDWFNRASENTKKVFVCGLARRMPSEELIQYIQHLIQPICCKDYTYSRTRSAPGLSRDQVSSHGDRTLDVEGLQAEIFDTWHWFAHTSHYAKMNYMLELLKLCDSHLLLTLKNQMRTVAMSSQRGLVEEMLTKMEERQHSDQANDQGTGGDNLAYDSDTASEETFISNKHPNLAFLKECKDPKQYTMDAKNPLSGRTFAKESRLRKQHRIKVLNKAIADEKKVAVKTATRRSGQGHHLTKGGGDGTVEPADTLPLYSQSAASGISKFKDFVRELPVYLSKYILNFLDKKSIASCVQVSRIWRGK